MLKIEKDIIQPLGDHNPRAECVRTSSVSHLIKYPFDYLNPMQSEFVYYLDDEDINVVVASPTCSGKTVVAELSAAKTIFGSNMKKKAMFLAPMKSLTEEKLRAWTDKKHTLSKLHTAVLNSDYALNKAKARELEEANIIVCTSEMLDSKTRSYLSNKWLHNIGVLIVDEVHLLGAEERGPRLETAIMRFTEYNPGARLILMSGTIPNATDLVEWIEKLSGKKTVLISSDYRPCKLRKHFIEFDDFTGGRNQYSASEEMRMMAVYDQILKNPNDQHIVFVGNKKFGRDMCAFLKEKGFSSEFHNADIDKDDRSKFEEMFNNENIQILVSSSTLAWGVNLNARRVILAHTTYGKSPMDVADIEQAVGRAGRIGFHTEGDAYILIPASKAYSEIKRITGGFRIDSKLKDQKVLAFHIVSEIAVGKIKNASDLFDWYKRSLSYSQNHDLTEDDCMAILARLKNIKMIKRDDKDEDVWVATQLGQITSIMYQKPFDVYDWFRNFSMLKHIGIQTNDKNKAEAEEIDLQVCWALANIDSYQESSGAFISAAEKSSDLVVSISKKLGKMVPATKIAACYWAMLKGEEPDDVLRSQFYTLKSDIQRVLFTLQLIHVKYARFLANKADYVVGWQYEPSEWDRLFLRFTYGVPRNRTFLVSLPGIGKVKAEKLFNAGIRSKQDFLTKRTTVKEILGQTTVEKLYNYLENDI